VRDFPGNSDEQRARDKAIANRVLEARRQYLRSTQTHGSTVPSSDHSSRSSMPKRSHSQVSGGITASQLRTAKRQGRVRIGGYKRGKEALKFIDFTVAGQGTIAVPAVIKDITVIPQGVGQSERIGRKIVFKKIEIRGLLTVSASSDPVRFVLIQDKQTNGAAFTVAEVMDNDYSYLPLNFRERENKERFKLLWDRTVIANAAITGVNHIYKVFKTIKCNIPVVYDATASTGAVATQRINSVRLVTGGFQTTGVIDMVIRVWYTDPGE